MPHRAIALAALLLSSALTFAVASTPAQAYDYPWCGYIPIFDGQDQSCSFSTLAQCRAFVSPNGYCDVNPRGNLARAPAPARRGVNPRHPG